MSDDFREMEMMFRVDCLPKLKQSVFVMGICDPENIDGFLLMQLGAAFLLEKPLILLVLKGMWVPPRVRQLATAVIEADSVDDPRMRGKLKEAIERIMTKERREAQPV